MVFWDNNLIVDRSRSVNCYGRIIPYRSIVMSSLAYFDGLIKDPSAFDSAKLIR